MSRCVLGRRCLFASVAAGLAAFGTTAHAGVEFQQKILNPYAGDSSYRYFGQAIGVSGKNALTSTYGKGGTVFFLRQQADGQWTFNGTASGEVAAGCNLGHAVAIDGDTALLGDNLNDGASFNGGAAFLYKYSDAGWTLDSSYHHGGGDDQCGRSVAISGSTCVLGAPFNDHADKKQGMALASNNGLVDLKKLQDPDGHFEDWAGWSVGTNGVDVLVGAYMEDTAGSAAGAVYHYRKNLGGEWEIKAKLLGSDSGPADEFGCSIAVQGNRAVIGAVGYDVGVKISVGAAYVFERDQAGVWNETALLLPSDVARTRYFGTSVALDGDRIVVGAPLDSETAASSGAAYVFEIDSAGVWRELAKLKAADAAYDDRFGEAVGISGDTIMVGAIYDDYDGHSIAGSIYVYAVPEPSSMLLSLATPLALALRRRR